MHKFVHAHDYYLNKGNMHELSQMSYVFVCVDKNATRAMITGYLVDTGISFSDVGLGVNLVDDKLIGAVRVTTATSSKNDHLSFRIFSEDSDNNEYATNIQIAELNCMNALFAILKWKRLSGFYIDDRQDFNTTFNVALNQMSNEEEGA